MKRTGSLKSVLLAALIALTLNATGCSLIFMERAPLDPETTDLFDCSGVGWPVIDTIFAVFSLVSAGLFIHSAANYNPDDKSTSPETSKGILLGLGISNLIWALFHGASAATGFCWADTCREAKQKRAQWIETRPPRTHMEQLDKSIEKAKQDPKEENSPP